jgi:hypothetical protein
MPAIIERIAAYTQEGPTSPPTSIPRRLGTALSTLVPD